MKILFLACAYNRPKILRLSLLGLQRLQKVRQFDTLIACSDKESIEVCKEFGVNYFEYENLPIGKKKNELFEQGLKTNADYFIEFADDDLMSNELFEHYIKEFQKGVDYIKPKGLYFYDTKSKRALNFNPQNTFGAFRAFSRQTLENAGNKYLVTFRQDVNEYKGQSMYYINKGLYDYIQPKGLIALHQEKFELWHPEKNKSLDFSSEANLMQVNVKATIADLGTPQVIDVKSEQNIWKFERYFVNSIDAKTEALFKMLSKEEINYIKTL
jgi:hypothetical protein